MPDHPVRIIVAYDEARVIGYNGRTPWDLPEDRRHFAHMTEGGVVIVGRVTYDDLLRNHTRGRPVPLAGRVELVVGTPSVVTCTAHLCSSFDAALWAARTGSYSARHSGAPYPSKPIWIIGGERVYRNALDANVVDEVIASEVKGRHEGDRHFPTLGPEWSEVSREPRRGFSIVRYVRAEVAARA